jgi:hypothetical protein
MICESCAERVQSAPACFLCRLSRPESKQEQLARLRRHVENEVPEAIKVLGDLYRHGDNVAMNKKKAAKIYRRGVQLGNLPSMLNLGSMYVDGEGIKRDEKKGTQLWTMAANRGEVISQYYLGQMAEESGRMDDAERWYELAASRGYRRAAIALELVQACKRLSVVAKAADAAGKKTEESRVQLARAEASLRMAADAEAKGYAEAAELEATIEAAKAEIREKEIRELREFSSKLPLNFQAEGQQSAAAQARDDRVASVVRPARSRRPRREHAPPRAS